jgi:hypothetical protein
MAGAKKKSRKRSIEAKDETEFVTMDDLDHAKKLSKEYRKRLLTSDISSSTMTKNMKYAQCFEQGTGRNENRLGAIICEGEDNDRRIRVNVGTGFSDALRDEYWANRDDLLGHLVEVQADAVTQNQDGSYSLRFPRFLRFRDFDAGEKV